MAGNARGNRRGAGRRGNRRGGQESVQNAKTRLPNHIVLKPSYSAPYKFSRSFSLGDLPKSASDQGYAFPFSLNQVPAATEFTALFDKYRITGVDLTFSYYFITTQSPASPGGASQIWPILNLYMDDDDAIIPTTKGEVEQRMSVQRVAFAPTRQTISVSLKPRFVQSRAGTSANLAPSGTWVDMSTPGVQHYGVKLWADFYNNGAPSSIAVSGVLHFECNNVR